MSLVAPTRELQRDHIDQFLERLDGIPGLDYEVEGIVDRINSLRMKFRRALEETLSQHGLTWPEWKVLGSLVLGEGDCDSPGELANALEVSSGAMTNRLDRLEQDGYIRRARDPEDRRGVKIELTDAGRRAWTESTSAGARKEALVAAALTKSEQRQLNGLLRKLMLQFEKSA
jgi:DNA-binding MarR family transcriptional regulator